MKKRIVECLFTVAMLSVVTACMAETSDAHDREISSYEAEDLNVGTGSLTAYYGMRLWGDCICYGMQNSIILQPLSEEEGDVVTFSWENAPSEEWELNCFTFGADGSIFALVNVFNQSDTIGYVCKFDSSSELVYSLELTAFEKMAGEYKNDEWTLETDNEGNLYLAGESMVWLFDEEGVYCGNLSFENSKGTAGLQIRTGEAVSVGDIVKSTDGAVYVSYTDNAREQSYIAEIDFDNKQVKMPKKTVDFMGLAVGMGNQLLAYDEICVYEYDYAAGNCFPLFWWAECDLNGKNVQSIELMSDGRILSVSNMMGMPAVNIIREK